MTSRFIQIPCDYMPDDLLLVTYDDEADTVTFAISESKVVESVVLTREQTKDVRNALRDIEAATKTDYPTFICTRDPQAKMVLDDYGNGTACVYIIPRDRQRASCVLHEKCVAMLLMFFARIVFQEQKALT
jgi:hypothetical protein